MNWYPLLGMLALVYALAVFFITIKKPTKIWEMKKIQTFIKVLGDKGTVIFFYIWGTAALVLSIWLFVK